jgi:hypothetical protein
VSAIAETARVALVLADYAQNDTSNKAYILGAGWQVTSLQPTTGQTAAQAVVVIIDVNPEHYDEQFAVEVTLHDDANEVVQTPGPTGEPTALRVSQVLKAEKPSTPGHFVPPKALWARVQVTLNFPAGLPIQAGRSYTWRVRIDGDDSRTWDASFHVAGPPPSTVIG